MSLLKWTSKSVAYLKGALQMGHTIADTALRDVLLSLGYSLRANKKNIEGRSHEDCDAQFAQIKQAYDQFEAHGDPIISVDCKKKELIGNFKNNGREWQAKREATTVNVYDFLSLADGKAVPYRVYDLVHNQDFVNVGIDHDTAAFAAESIRDGGSSPAMRSISARATSSSPLMAAVPTGSETTCGRRNFKSLPMKSTLRLP